MKKTTQSKATSTTILESLQPSSKAGALLALSIDRRAIEILGTLLTRGLRGSAEPDRTSWHQARKFAAAKVSWNQKIPEIGAASKQLHSRRRGGASHRLWSRIVELCESHLETL